MEIYSIVEERFVTALMEGTRRKGQCASGFSTWARCWSGT